MPDMPPASAGRGEETGWGIVTKLRLGVLTVSGIKRGGNSASRPVPRQTEIVGALTGATLTRMSYDED